MANIYYYTWSYCQLILGLIKLSYIYAYALARYVNFGNVWKQYIVHGNHSTKETKYMLGSFKRRDVYPG